MLEESLPLYRTAQLTYTNADLSATTDELWQIHDLFTKEARQSDVVVSPSLLDLKIEIAHWIHRNCHFCERRCSTDRSQKPGFCGVVESKYSSEFLHYGEERELVPSHTIFFTGWHLKMRLLPKLGYCTTSKCRYGLRPAGACTEDIRAIDRRLT